MFIAAGKSIALISFMDIATYFFLRDKERFAPITNAWRLSV